MSSLHFGWRKGVAIISAFLCIAFGTVWLVKQPDGAALAQATSPIGTIDQLPIIPTSGDGHCFLKIEGIPGESTDSAHKGEIDLLSFSWGESQRSSIAGGGGVGKVQMQDFHFTKQLDAASPLLMLHVATGKHYPEATLTCQGGGEKPHEYLVIKLQDVLISSYHIGGSSGIPTDQFSLNFTKIEFKYTPQRPDGTAGTPVKTGWDLKANKGI